MTDSNDPFIVSPDHNFDDLMQDSLDRFLAKNSLPAGRYNLSGRIPMPPSDIVDRVVVSTAESVLRAISLGSPVWETHKHNQLKFDRVHDFVWTRALDCLELFIRLSVEAGSNLYSAFCQDAAQAQDYKFAALIRLYARACQVSRSILVLLRAGYADAAFSRWRTLHEMSVYVRIIDKYEKLGLDVAERYVDYGAMQQSRLVKEMQKQSLQAGLAGMSRESLAKAGRAYNKVVSKYDEAFRKSYGWVAHIIPDPDIEKLEDKVGLSSGRALYRLASHIVHASSYNLLSPLGKTKGDPKITTGPSNNGVYLPGVATTTSLHNIAFTMLTDRNRFRDCVAIQMIKDLQVETKDEFARADALLATTKSQGST